MAQRKSGRTRAQVENDAVSLPSGLLEFSDYDEPDLLDGDYQITATQTVSSSDQTTILPQSFGTLDATFRVEGPRFSLAATDIAEVFPPDGSEGGHSLTLPHVILNRSTLPWERTALPVPDSSVDPSWLALLLFAGDEIPNPSVVAVSDLVPAVSDAGDDEIQVQVIDVDPALLMQLMPTAADLPWLSHVRNTGSDVENDPTELERQQLKSKQRRRTNRDRNQRNFSSAIAVNVELDEGSSDADEDLTLGLKSVVVGNRLPVPDELNVAHLVSIEGRFTGPAFDFSAQTNEGNVRLVSLKSWRFDATSSDQQFEVLLRNLNPYKERKIVTDGGATPDAARIQFPATLQLPPQPNPGNHPDDDSAISTANRYLSSGCVALPHFLRGAQKSISWYHGPLSTGQSTSTLDVDVDASDSLLFYDPDTGMFDASYAAAWELGRLLGLQDRQFSTALENYKQAYRREQQQLDQFNSIRHLPLRGMSRRAMKAARESPVELPNEVDSYFDDKMLLKNVPFNYLIPDPHALPVESIRFFEIDNLWVRCLLVGAFSIGTPSRLNPSFPNLDMSRTTGIMLRSAVVAGWPDLEILALGTPPDSSLTDQNLGPPIRQDRLSDNVLICIFSGVVSSVQINPRPEALHFGVEPGVSSGTYVRTLRPSGQVNVPLRSLDERIVDIDGLADAIDGAFPSESLSAGSFAKQMIEGTLGVVFAES
jgi:hypothetical protein